MDLSFKSVTDLAAMIRAREISSRELLDHYLRRLDRFNDDLNAIVVIDRERALAAADEADRRLARGDATGPLHGVPATIKESYDVAGLPTTWGYPHWRDNVAQADSVVVARLKQAGAVLFGKTNVPLALGDFQSFNEIYGITGNPWDLTRTPGGSSGGSAAALAAGLTAIESGSDIGGSIRNPAHFCGVFGHKPTFEVVPMRGHAPPGMLAGVDLAVVGPLARTASDLIALFNVVAGPDTLEAPGYSLALATPSQRTLGDFRVAVWHDDALSPVAAEVRERVDLVAEAFRRAGARVDHQARPGFDAAHSHAVYGKLLQAALAFGIPDDEFRALQAHVASLPEGDTDAESAILRSQVMTHREYALLHEQRTHLRWAWHRFFCDWDIVLTPAMATAAFPHDHRPFGERTIEVDGAAQPFFQQVFWAGLAGVSYLPGTIVPTGPNAAGLPIGVQIIGPAYGDRVTLEAARLLEREGFAFAAPPGYG